MFLPDGEMVKLNKSIYGLKQAPRVWNETIHNILVSLGLKATFQDPCVLWFNSFLPGAICQ